MSDSQISPLLPFTVEGRLVGARLCSFETGSAQPQSAHVDWVTRYFAPNMKKSPGAWVDLIGYASRKGPAAANMQLSKQRIAAVETLIRKNHPTMKFNIRQSLGEGAAESDNFEDGNNDAYWRAVLVRWYGVPLVIPTPEYPPPPSRKDRKLMAPAGCWCIIGVDSFGLPIKAGVSASLVTLTLLNDKGEKWQVKGVGGGPGVGIDLGPEHLKFLVNAAKEIALKAGDLPNVIESLKDLNIVGPNETAGGVFQRATWKANLSIDDITRGGAFMIGMAELQAIAAGGEVGVIAFQGPSPFTPLNLALGTPWGFYTSLGLGTLKAALGASISGFKITSVAKAA